jgi:hypothetical protein
VETKKLALFAGLVAFLAVGLASPPAAAKTFLAGVKGGGNLATVVGSDTDPPDGSSKKRFTGFSGGAFAALNVASFGVQTEFLYDVRGVTYASDSTDAQTDTRYNYFQIPVLLRFNVSLPAIPVTGKIMAGPSMSSFLSGKRTVEGENGSDETSFEAEDFRSPVFEAVAGLGADIGIGPGALIVDVRYEQGLSKIRDLDREDPSAYHSSVTGHVGFGIGF